MGASCLACWTKRLCTRALLSLLALPTMAADRVVITEEFTWDGCSHCPYANRAFNNLINDPNNQVVDGTFTLVQYHIWDSYATTWGNSRASFYHMPGTPTAWFDGTLWDEGAWDNDQMMYNLYLSEYTTSRAVATDVTLSVTGVQDSGQTFTIRARAGVEATGSPKTMRIYMVQVLDHWPTTFAYLRNGFKQAATSTEDVTLAAGQSQLVTRTFTFDTTSWVNQSNIKIIVWAQEPQADSTHADPASTYQAAVLSWPFPPDCNADGAPDATDIASGISADCNTNRIPDECDIAAGTSQDANVNGVPDECETLRGDMNCDGTVNFRDINPFVLLLSDASAWQVEYPACLLANGDINADGSVNFRDINPFVQQLSTP